MRISDWSSDVCSSDLQVRAVVGRHEGLERLHAGQISDDLIFALFEAENRIDQVVSNTSFALLHLEPVDEKVRDGAKQLRSHKLGQPDFVRSEEHTSELQSLMRISYAVICLKKKKTTTKHH